MQRLSAEGAGWVPTAGNLATLFAFGLCLALIPQLAQDFDEAIFVLAPILLLLNQARRQAVFEMPPSGLLRLLCCLRCALRQTTYRAAPATTHTHV